MTSPKARSTRTKMGQTVLRPSVMKCHASIKTLLVSAAQRYRGTWRNIYVSGSQSCFSIFAPWRTAGIWWRVSTWFFWRAWLSHGQRICDELARWSQLLWTPANVWVTDGKCHVIEIVCMILIREGSCLMIHDDLITMPKHSTSTASLILRGGNSTDFNWQQRK